MAHAPITRRAFLALCGACIAAAPTAALAEASQTKHIVPSVAKTAGSAAAAVGDAVAYTVRVTVPEGVGSPYTLSVVDVADEGLAVDMATVSVTSPGPAVAEGDWSAEKAGGPVLTVTVEDASRWAGSSLVVSYEATAGRPGTYANVAGASWSDPTGFGSTKESRADVEFSLPGEGAAPGGAGAPRPAAGSMVRTGDVAALWPPLAGAATALAALTALAARRRTGGGGE